MCGDAAETLGGLSGVGLIAGGLLRRALAAAANLPAGSTCLSGLPARGHGSSFRLRGSAPPWAPRIPVTINEGAHVILNPMVGYDPLRKGYLVVYESFERGQQFLGVRLTAAASRRGGAVYQKVFLRRHQLRPGGQSPDREFLLVWSDRGGSDRDIFSCASARMALPSGIRMWCAEPLGANARRE